MRARRQFTRHSFTLLEMLGVMVIIAILVAMLMPMLAQARKRAKFARWTMFSNRLRADPAMGVYYTFDSGRGSDRETLVNLAPTGGKGALDGKYYNGTEIQPYVGRWELHEGSYFNGLRNTRIEATQFYGGSADRGNVNPETSLTFFAWVMRTGRGVDGWGGLIVSREGNAGRTAGATLYAGADNKWQFWTAAKGSHDRVIGPSIVNGKWTQVVGTFKSNGNPPNRNHIYRGVGKIYVDGELVATKARMKYRPHRDNGSRKTVRVGCSEDHGPKWFFKGFIDEAGILSRAWSAVEVRDHYEMGKE